MIILRVLLVRGIRELWLESFRMGPPYACLTHVEGHDPVVSLPFVETHSTVEASISQSDVFTVSRGPVCTGPIGHDQETVINTLTL